MHNFLHLYHTFDGFLTGVVVQLEGSIAAGYSRIYIEAHNFVALSFSMERFFCSSFLSACVFFPSSMICCHPQIWPPQISAAALGCVWTSWTAPMWSQSQYRSMEDLPAHFPPLGRLPICSHPMLLVFFNHSQIHKNAHPVIPWPLGLFWGLW